MNEAVFLVREASKDEFVAIGELMVRVYSHLAGFPSEKEQPEYYKKLANIGHLADNPKTKLLVAVSPDKIIGGGVLYIGDMKYYGSGGIAGSEKNAAGFRLLAVDESSRGMGLGKLLSSACIEMAKSESRSQVIIHSTKTMLPAWNMYEKMGFIRSEDLDFIQGELPVFGFRLSLL